MNKQELIEKYRDINVDYDWWEHIYEGFEEDCRFIGFTPTDIYFSGFYSQGDGACFEGYVKDWGKFLPAVGYTDPDMIAHARGHWSLKVTHRGHYSHENSMQFEFDLPLPDEDEDDYNPMGTVESSQAQAREWFEGEAIEHLRNAAQELYITLRNEYEYQTTDEAVWDTLQANEMDGDWDDEPLT